MVRTYNKVYLLERISLPQVLLLDKSRHPRTLVKLEESLRHPHFGYGDKEMFWILSTASSEPFSFSPFMAGQYGDCRGMLLHFDPGDEDKGDAAAPLFLNGEKILETGINFVGESISEVCTKVLQSQYMI